MAYFNFTINGNTYTNDPTSGVPYGYKFTGYEYIPALGNLFTDLAATVATVLGYKTAAYNSQQAALISEGNASGSAGAALASALAAASSAAGLQGTSTTAVTISTGTKTFTTQTGKQFNNTWIQATDSGDSSRFVFGYCTYSGSTLSMNVANATDAFGSGSCSSWVLSVGGPRGLTGPTGAVGSMQTVSDYAQDTGTTTGVLYGFKAGDFRADNVCTHHNAGQVTLANNTTNYVYAIAAGPTSNTTGFPPGCFPMCTATTSAGAITAVVDKRVFALAMSTQNGGGLSTPASGSDIALTSTSARVQSIGMASPGFKVSLPVESTLTPGGPLFRIKNIGTIPYPVTDSSGNVKAVLQPKQKGVFDLVDNAVVGAYDNWSVSNDNFDGSPLQHFANGAVTAFTAAATGTNPLDPIKAVSLTATKILTVSVDSSTSKLIAVVVDVTNGNTSNPGTPYDVIPSSGTMQSGKGWGIAKLTSTTVAVFYTLSSSGFPNAIVLTVTGSSPSRGSPLQVTGNAPGAGSLSICALSATELLATAYIASNLYAFDIAVSGGNSLTNSGSGAGTATAPSYTRLAKIDNTKALLTYQNTSDTFAYAAIVTVSAGSPTVNAAQNVSTAVAATYVTACVVSTSQAIVSWANGTTNGQAILVNLGASTVNITGNTPFTYKTTQAIGTDIIWAGDRAIIHYANSAGYPEQTSLYISPYVSGSLTANTLVNQINTTAGSMAGCALLPNGKLFSAWRNGSSTFGNAVITDILS